MTFFKTVPNKVKVALRKRGGIVNLIKRYACIIREGKEVHVVGSAIEAVKSRLSTLRTRLQIYGIRELRLGEGTSSSNPQSTQRRSYAHIPDRNVVGLEGKIDEVVGLLLNQEEPCKAVSIYGIGGLGKTTLAKKVYHHDRIRSRFDNFAWVSISQHFKQRDVWESIFIELASPSAEQRKYIARMKDHELSSKVFKVLKDHKCFVVIDDIWSIGDWGKLSSAFPLLEETESKILFTTRKEQVASHIDQRGGYGGLQPLNDEQSLELLRMIALAGRDDTGNRLQMEELAKKMLKHCGGLPLAITVLAGILATKHSLSEWQIVHDNIKSYLRRGKGHEEESLGVYEVLAYSYYDLPYQLKSCFLYLSQFPEDHEIETKRLLRMWTAEGFVSVQYDGSGEESVEDVAERYLNEMVGRCMIQVGKEGSTGRIKTCRIHDLMRDMCLSKATEENFLHNYNLGRGSEIVDSLSYTMAGKAASIGRIRRLAIFMDRDFNRPFLSSYERNRQLRSVICYKDVYMYTEVRSCIVLKNFKLLRVLVLERITELDPSLPREIGYLIQLRYLSLRESLIHGYPSLENLGCLETLDLRVYGVKDHHFPSANAIWKMAQLRHLYLPYYIDYLVSHDHKLQMQNQYRNVQILINFPPPNCDPKEVARFPNLRKLKLKITDYSKEFGEIFQTQKVVFNRLWSLHLEMDDSKAADGEVDFEAIFLGCPHLYKLFVNGLIGKFPEANHFPKNLTKFTLWETKIKDPEHIATLGKLPSLKILSLWDNSFTGAELCFHEESFLQLKYLQLRGMHHLKKWRLDQGAMPALCSLAISGCHSLETVPDGLEFITTLKELHIKGMPREFKRRLEEGGNDFYKVQHIPSIVFTDCDR